MRARTGSDVTSLPTENSGTHTTARPRTASGGRAGSANRAVTMEDVARKVGVTRMTVSRVLNGTGRISPQVREAVNAAMRELDYRPNPFAQRLSSQRANRTVSLLTLNLDFGVTLDKLQHIQRLLIERGFDVPVYAFGWEGHRPERQAILLHQVCAQRPRAIVCCTTGMRDEALDELRRYRAEGGIVVCYDFPVEMDADKVIFDRFDNTYQAARHLLEIGHRRIGVFLHGDPTLQHERREGLWKALAEFGVPAEQGQVFSTPGLHAAAGAQMAERFLALPASVRPTGMCLVNDIAASTFLNEVMRAGVRVPAEVSVVALDDTPIARHCIVPLTAMAQPVAAIAKQVVELLLERLDALEEDESPAPSEDEETGPPPTEPRTVLLKGRMVFRASTAPPSSP